MSRHDRLLGDGIRDIGAFDVSVLRVLIWRSFALSTGGITY